VYLESPWRAVDRFEWFYYSELLCFYFDHGRSGNERAGLGEFMIRKLTPRTDRSILQVVRVMDNLVLM
jgi:hypothetical protein